MKGLDQELREFIVERISSVGLVDVLQLLWTDAERAWSVEEVSGELRTSDPSAVKHLQDLVAQGLAAVSPQGDVRYRYRPASTWLDSMAEQLIETYRVRRVSVTQAIHSRSAGTTALQSFSDAFRLRGDTWDR